RISAPAEPATATPPWRPDAALVAVMGCIVVQRMTRGAITVLLVAGAIDLLGMGDAGGGLLAGGAITVWLVAAAIDLLGMGDPGVGLLTAAIGLGGLVGATMAVGLAGRRYLAPWFAVGMVRGGGGS